LFWNQGMRVMELTCLFNTTSPYPNIGSHYVPLTLVFSEDGHAERELSQ
jgi:hypothetical protein